MPASGCFSAVCSVRLKRFGAMRLCKTDPGSAAPPLDANQQIQLNQRLKGFLASPGKDEIEAVIQELQAYARAVAEEKDELSCAPVEGS